MLDENGLGCCLFFGATCKGSIFLLVIITGTGCPTASVAFYSLAAGYTVLAYVCDDPNTLFELLLHPLTGYRNDPLYMYYLAFYHLQYR